MFIYMTKEQFEELVERSIELAEFHSDDIRDLAKNAKPIPEGMTHFIEMRPIDPNDEGSPVSMPQMVEIK